MLAVAVGGTLLLAGVFKLRQPYLFLYAVYDHQLVGFAAGEVLAASLPWLEVTLGLLLLTGIWRAEAFAASGALLALFAAVQGLALARGLEIACGCFALDGASAVTAAGVARTAMLSAAALAGLVACRR